MLAYVFWHRPREDADVVAYEDAQRSFHGAIEEDSACFRVAQLPFASEPGYEDWYLVQDWNALGRLNEAAVDAVRQSHHDRAAAMAAQGWGAVYRLAKGDPVIPDGTTWFDKRRGESRQEMLAAREETTVWQRQLVLGPAPEFCAGAPPAAERVRVWPD